MKFLIIIIKGEEGQSATEQGKVDKSKESIEFITHHVLSSV